jgi:hypothetical protein
MNNVAVPVALQLAELDALVGGADFTGAKLHLFKNNLTPTPNTLLADFTPADYSGYAAKTVTWSDAYFDSNDDAIVSGGEHLFAQTGATGNDIYGAYLTDSAGTKLLRSARLPDAPYPLDGAGDVLPVLVKIGLMDGLISVSPEP